MINNGLAPYFKELLEEKVSLSYYYVVSFDESVCDITQKPEIDIIIRYLDNINKEVKIRVWGAHLLGQATHTDLIEHVSKLTTTLSSAKIIQVSMDGPNVKLKFSGRLSQYREECKLLQLVAMGTCGLHVVHGAFRASAECSR